MSAPELSIVIPARNEAENLASLLPELAAVLAGRAHETIVVDDGSSDDTAGVVRRLAAEHVTVRLARHRTSLGKSAALVTGALAAASQTIVTLDGDGQNDPRFVAPLLAPFADPRIGLVVGQRLERGSSASRDIGSRIANRARRALLHDGTRDTACGAKAFRRDAFLHLPYFENMHRFLPALFLGDGWQIAHVDVIDRPRRHGASNYGNLDRLLVGIPDLFGVWWLRRRRRRNPFTAEPGPNDRE
jgi:glycosyltransferase involved in cell wall biosynthesis